MKLFILKNHGDHNIYSFTRILFTKLSSSNTCLRNVWGKLGLKAETQRNIYSRFSSHPFHGSIYNSEALANADTFPNRGVFFEEEDCSLLYLLEVILETSLILLNSCILIWPNDTVHSSLGYVALVVLWNLGIHFMEWLINLSGIHVWFGHQVAWV